MTEIDLQVVEVPQPIQGKLLIVVRVPAGYDRIRIVRVIAEGQIIKEEK